MHRSRWQDGGSSAWTKLRAQRLAIDGHRCTWVEDGERCTEVLDLQVHHLDPDAPQLVPLDRLRTACTTHHALVRAGGRREGAFL